MITLHKTGDTIQIANLVEGRRETPIYWHPIEKDELMNSVENLGTFNDAYFRDRFELSEQQASDIFGGLASETVVEKNQSKYFKVKRHLKQNLLHTMNIADTKGEFHIDFEPNPKEYSHHMLLAGGTASGKTHFGVAMVLRNLEGKKENIRHFLIISSEWDEDSTLKPLKQEKYQQFVKGIDVSENSLKDSEWNTSDEFFANEVKLRVNHAPRGAVVLIDDGMDSCCPTLLRRLVNRGLRVFRHQGISLMVIVHSIRSSSWSAQAYNSIRYLVLFPRSQKGKITNYLNQDVGLPLKDARETVREFSQTGRHMVVRIHAPECLIGPKLIKIL